jgi:hypothetical protein
LNTEEDTLVEDLEWIVAGWFDKLSVEDVKQMAAELREYVIETYGPQL